VSAAPIEDRPVGVYPHVGGCCGLGPSYIEALAAEFSKPGVRSRSA
jgi:hypothetical protein